jgi:hypothetical protein
MTATVMMYYMAFLGAYGWHIWLRTKEGKSLMMTPEARIFGNITHSQYLCAGIMAYQTWDFMASLYIPEHRSLVFLVHHVLSAITAYLSIEFQMVHYYSLYFGGCSEISSLFLVWIDLDKFFPLDAAFMKINQALFVISFVAYRVVGWPLQSIPLWKDVSYVLQHNKAQKYRPGKLWFLRVFLFMDVALGALQIYWFVSGILPKVLEVVVLPKEEQ